MKNIFYRFYFWIILCLKTIFATENSFKMKQNLRYPINIFFSIFLVFIAVYNIIYYENLTLSGKIYTMILVLMLTSFYFWFMFFVASPLEEIKKTTTKILQGNHKLHLEVGGNKDIKDLAEQINLLNSHIVHAAFNIHDIKSGKIVTDLEDRQDIISEALLSMQKQFKEIKLKEYEQNWVVAGLAKFVEILKNEEQGLEKLYANILSTLIDYLNASQGGLFLAEENENESFLELVTCYAYDKQIRKTVKIYKGEGLLGQVFADKEPIYLTKIPDNYFEISSGLGSSKANSLLILPLLLNKKIYGVLELASFKSFKAYELEFLQKLAQSLAATIANSQSVQKIKKLLEESVEKSEKLSSQEEEMRQNMEELISTQEEMERKQAELEESNRRMQAGESVLKKALAKAKEKDIESKRLVLELQSKSELLSAAEEEMKQSLEELITTQDEMRFKQLALETVNQKMQANEEILKKAILKAREKDAEARQKTIKIAEDQSLFSKKMDRLNEKNEDLERKYENLEFENRRMQSIISKNEEIIAQLTAKISRLETKNKKS